MVRKYKDHSMDKSIWKKLKIKYIFFICLTSNSVQSDTVCENLAKKQK